MKRMVGSLPKGKRIVLTEFDDNALTVSRLVVGRSWQDDTGKPVVEVRRPNERSIYTRLPADFIVEV